MSYPLLHRTQGLAGLSSAAARLGATFSALRELLGREVLACPDEGPVLVWPAVVLLNF